MIIDITKDDDNLYRLKMGYEGDDPIVDISLTKDNLKTLSKKINKVL